jgi:hypothetical protein
MAKRKMQRWTSDELRILDQALAEKLTHKEIGQILGRSEKAVQLKAYKSRPTKIHVLDSLKPAAQPQHQLLHGLMLVNIGLTIVLIALNVIN